MLTQPRFRRALLVTDLFDMGQSRDASQGQNCSRSLAEELHGCSGCSEGCCGPAGSVKMRKRFEANGREYDKFVRHSLHRGNASAASQLLRASLA